MARLYGLRRRAIADSFSSCHQGRRKAVGNTCLRPRWYLSYPRNPRQSQEWGDPRGIPAARRGARGIPRGARGGNGSRGRWSRAWRERRGCTPRPRPHTTMPKYHCLWFSNSVLVSHILPLKYHCLCFEFCTGFAHTPTEIALSLGSNSVLVLSYNTIGMSTHCNAACLSYCAT